MVVVGPGSAPRRWCARGFSLNGRAQYEIVIEAILPTTAREMLREYVVQKVKTEHGTTPAGVPWLVDPRTITVEEVSAT